MSVFDLFDSQALPKDKIIRKIKYGTLEYEHFRQNTEGQDIFSHEKKKITSAYIICVIACGILIFQLLNLQISKGSFNRNLAQGNSRRVREIPAPRGLIYDSQGKVIARNQVSFNLEIYPLELPRKEAERKVVLQKIAQTAQIPLEDMEEKIYEKGINSYDPIVLKENIDRETALLLEVKTVNIPGVTISKRPIREYELIDGLSPILGYVGKVDESDLKANPQYRPFYEIGKLGLEKSYEKYLKGTPGISEVEVDSKGRQQRQITQTLSKPGHNIVLGLDSELEYEMGQSLGSMIDTLGVPGGSAVAMNPANGQILGMVSLPTFDNNLFTSNKATERYQELLSDPSKPMFNRAISGVYPSGSIIKPVVALAGLQEGVITDKTTIHDPGEIKVGSWSYPDWKNHGYVDVYKAIAESCNVFFYAIAGGWDKINGLGVEKLKNYFDKFGFGEKTNIDIAGEAEGLVPGPDWKEAVKKESWYLGDTYHMGIGQGDFLVTPLQMAVITSTIANNGEQVKPRFVLKVTGQDNETIEEFNKEVIRKDMVSQENITIVKNGMRQAVTSGSARIFGDLPVQVAAKTGTAQFGAEGKTHAWITAFAPFDDPKIAVAVLVEAGGEGYASAGPVAYEILKWYFNNR